MPMQAQPTGEFQEIEADAFAVEFMMPRGLVACMRFDRAGPFTIFGEPSAVYQLSLRIGASYEATCWTLARHRFIQATQARKFFRPNRVR